VRCFSPGGGGERGGGCEGWGFSSVHVVKKKEGIGGNVLFFVLLRGGECT